MAGIFQEIPAGLDNWQVVLVVFHSVILTGGGTVPVHSMIIFKAAIRTGLGHIEMAMPYVIAGSHLLSKIKMTLGDLAMIAGLDFRST